jgi:hypothetical protein
MPGQSAESRVAKKEIETRNVTKCACEFRNLRRVGVVGQTFQSAAAQVVETVSIPV